MTERADTDHKRTLDLDRPLDRLLLARDAAAMANAGGGTIAIGVTSSDDTIGVPAKLADKLTLEAIRSLLIPYTDPDDLGVSVDRRPVDDGAHVVEIHVPAATEPPVVMARPGVIHDAGTDGSERVVFDAHSVWVRRSTRSQPARRDDYRRWRDDAIALTKQEILQRLAMAVAAPEGSRIQIVTGDDVLDEPAFLLRRSADLFRQRPERLLAADDLTFLWLHRAGIDLSVPDAKALLVQSALRKRATLFLWLAELELSRDEIKRQLRKALTMHDRDKSDAARSILQVSALHLGSSDYARLRTALAESGYAHMRRAAQLWPEPSDARASFDALGNARYQRLTDRELEAEAETIVRDHPSRAIRVLPGIGFTLLNRRMARRGQASLTPVTRRQ